MMLYNYTYSYSLLSYLEYPILLVQEYVLIALVLKYKNMLNQNSFTIIGGYWVFVFLFAFQICPRFLLYMTVVSIKYATIFLFLNFSWVFSHFVHQSERPVKFFNCWKFSDQRIQLLSVSLLGFCQHSPIWVRKSNKYFSYKKNMGSMKLIYHKKKHHFYSPGLYHSHWNRWYDAADELYDIVCTQYVRLFGGIRLQTKSTKNIRPEKGVRDQQRLKLDSHHEMNAYKFSPLLLNFHSNLTCSVDNNNY